MVSVLDYISMLGGNSSVGLDWIIREVMARTMGSAGNN